MELLLDEDVTGYCLGSPARRGDLWAKALPSADCPAFVLPLFEICRSIHFTARAAGRLDIDSFRGCWDELVRAHDEHMKAFGARLRLLDGGDAQSDNLPRDIWLHSSVAPDDEEPRNARGDARDRRPFREAFRAIARAGLGAVLDEEEWERQFGHPLPDLAEREWTPAAPVLKPTSENLLLDTNFFVELLEEVSADEFPDPLPCLTGRPARSLRSARHRFERILDSRGQAGKLVVPSAVLVETYGIVRVSGRRRGTYQNADRVMEAIAINGSDWPLWNAFDFEPLTMDVLDAFLELHRELIEREPDSNHWPDFTDSFVLAHGLVNECPVLSGEWVDKNDWGTVRRLLPHLAP